MRLAVSGERLVATRIGESAALKQRLADDPEFHRALVSVAGVLLEALRNGGKLFFFGNGGSAADAQHLVAELTGRYLRERSPVAALALSVNSSSLTAIANDYSYECVFARQLQALGSPGDVAIGISTSGNSLNVLRAFETARQNRIITVAITGHAGGRMKLIADHCICIPSDDTPRIQEAHILTGHILCELVEEGLCND